MKLHLERFKNKKNFLPRERGHPFPWTPSPAASALRASARILGPLGLACAPLANPVHPWTLSLRNLGSSGLVARTQQQSKSRPPPFEIL